MKNKKAVDDHTMLNRFLTRQIKEIYERFSYISEAERETIKSFISKVEVKVDFDIYEDYDITKGLAETLEEESDIDFIRLYMFLTIDLK